MIRIGGVLGRSRETNDATGYRTTYTVPGTGSELGETSDGPAIGNSSGDKLVSMSRVRGSLERAEWGVEKGYS